ncbi:MAG: AI-2E family transporter [Fervidobacterium sp.]
MKSNLKENIKNDRFLVFAYFLIFLFLSWKVPFVIGALLISFYFSVLLNFSFDLVYAKTKKKWLAWLFYSLVIAIFVYALVSFLPITLQQIYNIFQEVKSFNADKGFANLPNLPSWIIKIFDDLRDNVSNLMIVIINKVISILPTVFTTLMLLIVTIIGIENIKSYFKGKIEQFFVDDPEYGEKFTKTLYKDITRYVKGQVSVSLISSTLTVFGLFLIGIPSAITLGVLTFLGGFFPFIGLIVSAIPMYLLAITTGGLRNVIFLTILLVLVNQLESWFYGPKIQGNSLRLHWFVILISIFLFGSLFGFVGILIAMPVLLFIRDYWRFYVKG